MAVQFRPRRSNLQGQGCDEDMANEENLIPFQPGQSGNPNGRPKGRRNFTTVLEEILSQEIKLEDPIVKKEIERHLGDWVMLQLVVKALKGDRKSIINIMEKLEGKVYGGPLVSIHNKNENHMHYTNIKQLGDRELDNLVDGIIQRR